MPAMRAASMAAATLAPWVTFMQPLHKRRERLWIKSASPDVQARTIARDFMGILGNILTAPCLSTNSKPFDSTVLLVDRTGASESEAWWSLRKISSQAHKRMG